MSSLARRQERELRAWLYGHPNADGEQLAAAMQEMASGIEDAHEVAVDVVVVGDCPLNDSTRPVLHACREAAANAAHHSGAEEISVYVECEPGVVNAFVRDRGTGFDPDKLETERRGIADSIRGRIERAGGTVSITSKPGEGCEVHMTMPVAT
jgi:signal transduction histidine kinase